MMDWRGQEVSGILARAFFRRRNRRRREGGALRHPRIFSRRRPGLSSAREMGEARPPRRILDRCADLLPLPLGFKSLRDLRDELEKWPMLAAFFSGVRSDASGPLDRIEVRLRGLEQNPGVPNRQRGARRDPAAARCNLTTSRRWRAGRRFARRAPACRFFERLASGATVDHLEEPPADPQPPSDDVLYLSIAEMFIRRDAAGMENERLSVLVTVRDGRLGAVRSAHDPDILRRSGNDPGRRHHRAIRAGGVRCAHCRNPLQPGVPFRRGVVGAGSSMRRDA